MNRLQELEQLIESKRASMSKSSFRSWYNNATEVMEYCQLKSARSVSPTNTANAAATERQIAYITSLYQQYGVRWVAPASLTKNEASRLIDQIKHEPSSLNLFRYDGSL